MLKLRYLTKNLSSELAEKLRLVIFTDRHFEIQYILYKRSLNFKRIQYMKKIAVDDFLVFAIKNYVRKNGTTWKTGFSPSPNRNTFENIK